jgi:PhnB protein
MADNLQPVPGGFHTITPYLVVRDAPGAISFYARAFGAVERLRLTDPDGRVRHAELEIGDSHLFITDIRFSPETNVPDDDDTSPVWLYLYVTDPDSVFDRAASAGALVVTPIGNQPWGDRYGCLRDPFGYRWGIASRREDLTEDELTERMRKAYADD